MQNFEGLDDGGLWWIFPIKLATLALLLVACVQDYGPAWGHDSDNEDILCL